MSEVRGAKGSGPQKRIIMRIVAKSRMHEGFCYMGFTGYRRFFRPIYKTQTNQCNWGPNEHLEVGSWYDFEIRRYPGQRGPPAELPPTKNPHAREDTVVAARLPARAAPYGNKSLYEMLCPVAKESLRDVFGRRCSRDFTAGYFDEGTDCPSVGVLRCTRDQFRIYDDLYRGYRQRVRLDTDGDSYDMALTCSPRDGEDEDEDQEVLLLLGLGRPWDRNGEYFPARCYLLVLGVFYGERRSRPAKKKRKYFNRE